MQDRAVLRAAALALVAAPALADHPVTTEDVNVLERGRWHVQVHGGRARTRGDDAIRATTTELQLRVGVEGDADVQVGIPYFRETTNGDVAKGLGDISVAYRKRFYESPRVSLFLAPAVSVPTGRDELAFGTGRASWSAELLAVYELTDRVELLGVFGYDRHRNRIGERQPIRHVSGAALLELTQRLTLTVSVAQQTDPRPGERRSVREVAYGVIYDLSKTVELGLALNRPLNAAAEDGSVLFALRLRY